LKIILIDNYDSFTYNLVHLIEKVTNELPVVKRNDELDLDELESYDLIILSPGPGIPREAGLLLAVIEKYACTKPIIGVCLGLQALIEVFGGQIENLNSVYHGVATKIKVTDESSVIFKGLKSTILGLHLQQIFQRNLRLLLLTMKIVLWQLNIKNYPFLPYNFILSLF